MATPAVGPFPLTTAPERSALQRMCSALGISLSSLVTDKPALIVEPRRLGEAARERRAWTGAVVVRPLHTDVLLALPDRQVVTLGQAGFLLVERLM
jgi:hypothetical protein